MFSISIMTNQENGCTCIAFSKYRALIYSIARISLIS